MSKKNNIFKELAPRSRTYELHGQGKKNDQNQQTNTSHCSTKTTNIPLTLSHPLDLNYILEQGQGHGHLSKYLISGLIFHFFHVYMKKTSNPSLKKKVS